MANILNQPALVGAQAVQRRRSRNRPNQLNSLLTAQAVQDSQRQREATWS
jgi:hypothetical protein